MGDNPSMSANDSPLRVGVVGAGAFGRNHARVDRDLQGDPALNVRFVGIVDADPSRARAVSSEFGTRATAKRTSGRLISRTMRRFRGWLSGMVGSPVCCGARFLRAVVHVFYVPYNSGT